MANKSTFDLELGVIKARVADLDLKLHAAISLAVDEVTTFGVSYAKTTARWTDRTGAARAGLHGYSSHSPKRWEIVFAHAVSYGIWLEVANSGKYQIIMPTVKIATDRMAHHLQGMMGDLR